MAHGRLGNAGIGNFRRPRLHDGRYGCYRTGTRALCDFDVLKANAAQVGVGPFANVVMVDDSGQITRRHDAYYMSTDGTRMQAAYISTAPVRYIMEFDNVGEQFNSVALVSGSEQIKNVPISASGAKAQYTRELTNEACA